MTDLLHDCTPIFKPAEQAFRAAIQSGRLSDDPLDDYYAGHYMYMGTVGSRDTFKHALTRQYLP